jgi:hypothetical protein
VSEIPFDEIIRRAKDNCVKDGCKWEAEASGRKRRDAPKGPRSISENTKRTHILDAERQLQRRGALTTLERV